MGTEQWDKCLTSRIYKIIVDIVAEHIQLQNTYIIRINTLNYL